MSCTTRTHNHNHSTRTHDCTSCANTLYFLSAQADAIREAIEKTKLFSNLTFFVSHSSLINGYKVHTCIGIPTEAIEALPAFKESEVGRFHVGKSLQHEVIRECLSRADSVLDRADPEEHFAFGPISLGNVDDIIKTATERFVSGIGWRSAKESSDLSSAMHSQGIFRALNEIASLTYERDAAKGKLTITSRENLEKWLTVRFKEPVKLHESRTIRKLLQMSDEAMSVLADPAQAYGLGPSKTAPDVVEVSISGHAKWEVSVNGDKFVRVAYGKPTSHTNRLNSKNWRTSQNESSGTLTRSLSGRSSKRPKRAVKVPP